jgi:hypothetical protein
MPGSIRATWLPENDFRFSSYVAEDWELARQSYLREFELVREMRRAGVGFLAGTDALNPYCFPGFSLHDELALLVQAGLTPMEALQAATINPAVYMGRSDQLGTVAKGKLADLILLDANPLNDIGNTKRISAVFLGGRLFDKSQLDGILAGAEKIASLKSIADAIRPILEKEGLQAAIQRYRELKASQADAYDFAESQLNSLGYRLLKANKIKEAIDVFELNVANFPDSGNAYDSLAEAYMANGDNELAIKNYKKSLALDAKNANAVEMLKKLGAE